MVKVLTMHLLCHLKVRFLRFKFRSYPCRNGDRHDERSISGKYTIVITNIYDSKTLSEFLINQGFDLREVSLTNLLIRTSVYYYWLIQKCFNCTTKSKSSSISPWSKYDDYGEPGRQVYLNPC
ncbi:hypothetical protein CS542_07990 [Pedobacter sp. IW39]|nr:hypothetical protein CS542_07990 [Pedobacter sp. IW39]